MKKNFSNEIIVFHLVKATDKNLFNNIKNNTIWDLSIKARKTASFGQPYNYSDICYPYAVFPSYLSDVLAVIKTKLGYEPNNCLVNFYDQNSSSMGYHSDRTDILEQNTGITILSLGGGRIMRFKNKITKEIIDVKLLSNTFFHMSANLQNDWLHSILPSSNNALTDERISLTFRKLMLINISL